MGRRLPLLIAAALVVAGAAWFLHRGSTAGDPGLARRSPAAETADRGVVIPPRDAPTAKGAARDPLEVTAAAAAPLPDDDALRVGVLLVAGDTKQPLAGYHVQALPVGTSPLVSPGRRSPWVTDRDGRVAIGDLDGDGPWDIHAWPVDWGGSGFDPWAESRVGSARPTRSGVWSRFEVEVGPTVIYRGGLPPGVQVEDLILEAQATISPISSMLGGSGGTATARSTDEGFALARIRPIMNTMQEDGFIVRAVTRDGLWSTMRIEPGRLSNRSVVHLDDPLRPRGKVAIRIEFDPPGDQHDPEVAVRWVQWSLPLQAEPPGAAPGTPRGLWNAAFHPVGGGVFELHDLPLGPVEFRTPAGGDEGGWADELTYSLAAPVRVDAVHGPPTPQPLRLRGSR